jgi:cell division protein FtsW
VPARPGLLDRPLTSYYLVLGITMLLLALGLVMVLSTTSAAALDSGGSPYAGFQKQLVGVAIGLPLMWLAARSSPAVFRAAAYPLMAVSVIGLLLAITSGVTSGGAARWVQIGPFQLQPSEFAKLAFLLWGADLLARKEKLGQLTDWRQLLIPLMPGAGLLCMLVMLGDDLGTTFLLLIIFLALLWVIGTPGRLFIGMLALMGFVMIILIIVAPYRLERITGFLNPRAQTGAAYQPTEGKYALGSGGWFGVGLGASRAKWGWVPNSTTDFIFAIIGEELGLVGTLCVTMLYGGLAYAGLRIARPAA